MIYCFWVHDCLFFLSNAVVKFALSCLFLFLNKWQTTPLSLSPSFLPFLSLSIGRLQPLSSEDTCFSTYSTYSSQSDSQYGSPPRGWSEEMDEYGHTLYVSDYTNEKVPAAPLQSVFTAGGFWDCTWEQVLIWFAGKFCLGGTAQMFPVNKETMMIPNYTHFYLLFSYCHNLF